MTYDDVYRESLHDWLDEREALAADERPTPSEYESDNPEHVRAVHEFELPFSYSDFLPAGPSDAEQDYPF
jgi:hypothetical protein